MIGLKSGTVVLEPHQEAWDAEGKRMCDMLKKILGNDAIDVQHVGSTSIKSIQAKPIIDVAVAVKSFEDIFKHNGELEQNGIVYRKEDIPGQQLYRSGDLDNSIVTHYIHVVIADSDAWHNYINFRDYLNTHKISKRQGILCKRKKCFGVRPAGKSPLVENAGQLVFLVNHPISFCAIKIFTKTRIAPRAMNNPANRTESSMHKRHLQMISVFIGRQIKLVMHAGI